MEHEGTSRRTKVRIIAESGWLAPYRGQVCAAILYTSGPRPQIDTEQLTPPMPSWQSADWKDIQELDRDPRSDPRPGDVLHRWDQNFLVTRVSMGCVFTQPKLSSDKDWVGVMFFQRWAADADVAHIAPTEAKTNA